MKKFLKRIAASFRPVINRMPFNNRFKLRGNKICFSGAKLKRCKINCYGKGNVIRISRGANISNTTVFITGNNNTVEIGENVLIRNGSFAVEDNNNHITIGKNCKLTGSVHFALIEGTAVRVGEDCLFSYEITLRTGDGHSVLDENFNRINPSADISIGNHVWVGHRATIGKGVNIPDNCIVGNSAVVTKSIDKSNCIVAGIPAKVIKENINWKFERV